MKHQFLVAVVLAVSIAPAWADYQKGNLELRLNWGLEGYSHDVKVNNGNNTLNWNGGVGGFQALYVCHSNPTLAIGPDVLWIMTGSLDPSRDLPNSDSHAGETMTTYRILGKLMYPRGHFRPYLTAGIGAIRSSLYSDITPGPGAFWGDTGTSERRQTFDSVHYGVSGSVGIGFTLFLREHWSLGVEYGTVYLPAFRHEPTEAGRSLGFTSVRDVSSIETIMFSLGYKFGSD